MATSNSECATTIHPLTANPTKAWQILRVKQNVEKVQPLPLDTPIHADKLRVVCISDTHGLTDKMSHPMPPGDVLIHAGDFTNVGKLKDVLHFKEFLAKQSHAHKVFIAGNHDLTFDEYFTLECPGDLQRFGVTWEKEKKQLKDLGVYKPEDLFTGSVYLKDSGVNISGVRIYGSPWQPKFGNWGFNLERGKECLEKWDRIPEDTDILITHGPPIGHGDLCFDSMRAGCVELLTTIQNRVKPKYHIFGHIHEGYGITSDGVTTYINASTCTFRYAANNAPIIFDFPIPAGHTKGEPLERLTNT